MQNVHLDINSSLPSMKATIFMLFSTKLDLQDLKCINIPQGHETLKFKGMLTMVTKELVLDF